MSSVIAFAGAVLIAAALWDVFHGLFHPSGQGAISHTVMAGVWAGAPAS
ncbi:hypothetical protein [Isoptericola sp. NPDC057391]